MAELENYTIRTMGDAIALYTGSTDPGRMVIDSPPLDLEQGDRRRFVVEAFSGEGFSFDGELLDNHYDRGWPNSWVEIRIDGPIVHEGEP